MLKRKNMPWIFIPPFTPGNRKAITAKNQADPKVLDSNARKQRRTRNEQRLSVCQLFKVCNRSRATEHEEEYFEPPTTENAWENRESKLMTLSDYIDKLAKDPPKNISKTLSNDVPTCLPKVKRFLSYQGELDDLLLHMSAEMKDKRRNESLSTNPLSVPTRLYHSPEHHFSHCPKHLVEELRNLKIGPMENLKEKSSYFASKKNDMPAPKALKRVFREIRKDLPRGLDIDAYGSMFVRFDEDAPVYEGFIIRWAIFPIRGRFVLVRYLLRLKISS